MEKFVLGKRLKNHLKKYGGIVFNLNMDYVKENVKPKSYEVDGGVEIEPKVRLEGEMVWSEPISLHKEKVEKQKKEEPKPKIKFNLFKFEKALGFQVLEMDERFRCNETIELFKCHETDFIVKSDCYPDIEQTNRILLMGEKRDKDDTISIKKFETNEERDEYYTNSIKALKNWSLKWERFIESDVKIPEDHSENNITTLY